MARPTKYDDLVAERIAQGIKLGLTYDLAAAFGGITYETFRVWREKKPAFSALVERVEAEGAAVNMGRIQKEAQEGDWRAAAWIIEHRYGKQFAKTERQEITGKDGEPFVLRLEVVS